MTLTTSKDVAAPVANAADISIASFLVIASAAPFKIKAFDSSPDVARMFLKAIANVASVATRISTPVAANAVSAGVNAFINLITP